MKLGFLVVFGLGVAITACSANGGSGETGGGGGAGGESPVTSANSSSSSSGSSSSSSSSSSGGATPKADKLGQPCNAAMPCPTDYKCILLDTMATSGFCTINCGGQTDMTSCSSANGFAGPGSGQCALQAKDASGTTSFVCGIFCGAQFNLPDMCPTGLTCQDKFNAMGMPGTDGKNDFCLP